MYAMVVNLEVVVEKLDGLTMQEKLKKDIAS
jgi:hypothetical protein